MRSWILFLTAMLTVSAKVQAQVPSAQAHQFPKVVSQTGQASIKQKGADLKAAALKKALRENVLIETGANGQVNVQISPAELLIVGAGSRLLIPAIDWDTGKIEEIELLGGRILLKIEEPKRFRTPLSRDRLEKGRYEFGFDPERAHFHATVLEGSMQFRGLETEHSSTLVAGETQIFQGEKHEGELQYDVLLAGRKVARGVLLPKRKLSVAELSLLEKLYIPKKSKAVVIAPVINKREGNTFCSEPDGAFNECAYLCLNNPKKAKDCQVQDPKVSCVRRRCLASGQWGDEFVFTSATSRCSAKPIVETCDY